jgi:hypothetical protein
MTLHTAADGTWSINSRTPGAKAPLRSHPYLQHCRNRQ